MTWKLTKFEFRFSFKFLIIIWAAFLVSTLIACATGALTSSNSMYLYDSVGVFATTINVVTTVLYFIMLVAVVVLTGVIVIVRFYRGLVGDEGYLMHTLPVKAWQLITAKGIVATCAVVISYIIIGISLLIIFCVWDKSFLGEVIREIGVVIIDEPSYIFIGIELLVILLFNIMYSVYQVYASISIGQLANRHRLLASLGAYIGINIVLSLVTNIIIAVLNMSFNTDFIYNWIFSFSFIDNEGLTGSGQLVLVCMLLINVAVLVGLHFVTERILTKKLNLL